MKVFSVVTHWQWKKKVSSYLKNKELTINSWGFITIPASLLLIHRIWDKYSVLQVFVL